MVANDAFTWITELWLSKCYQPLEGANAQRSSFPWFHWNFIALLYFSRQMLEGLKKIDAFPKAFDDFRVKTTTGALGMQRTLLFCLPRLVLTQSISHFLSFHYLNNHYGDLIFLWDVLLSEDGKRFSILFSTPSRTHFTEIFRKRLTTCTLTEHGPTSSM